MQRENRHINSIKSHGNLGSNNQIVSANFQNRINKNNNYVINTP